MEDSDSIHPTDSFASVDCRYEIPEDVNETVLMNLGKNIQMETFKTNIAPQEQHAEGMSQNDEDNLIVILCVGTITGKDSVLIKNHFLRKPPKGINSSLMIMRGYTTLFLGAEGEQECLNKSQCAFCFSILLLSPFPLSQNALACWFSLLISQALSLYSFPVSFPRWL